MPGIVVRQFWWQLRWLDGRIFTWLAREKMYSQPLEARLAIRLGRKQQKSIDLNL